MEILARERLKAVTQNNSVGDISDGTAFLDVDGGRPTNDIPEVQKYTNNDGGFTEPEEQELLKNDLHVNVLLNQIQSKNKILAFDSLRPESNLRLNEKYNLTSIELRSGFSGIFSHLYTGSGMNLMVRLCYGAISADASLLPMIYVSPKASTPDQRAEVRDKKKKFKTWLNARSQAQKLHLATVVRKVNDASNPHFLVSIPVMTFTNSTTFRTCISYFTNNISGDNFDLLDNLDATRIFPAEHVLKNARLPGQINTQLSECLKSVTFQVSSKTDYVTGNRRIIASVQFMVNKVEAEYIASTDWLEIRPVDLYPVMSEWTRVNFQKRAYATRSRSVSSIASTLPPHISGDERIDSFGISIDANGAPMYLPKQLNNTGKYEELFTAAGSNQDGSFTLINLDTLDSDEKTNRLPVNQPILVDWVNFKFVYTNTNGDIEIIKLEHYRKCNASMALNLLPKFSFYYAMSLFVRLASVSGTSTKFSDWAKPDDFANLEYTTDVAILKTALRKESDLIEVVNMFQSDDGVGETTINSLQITSECEPQFRFALRFVKQLYKDVLQNMDSVNAKYSVKTITENFGLVALFANYGGDVSTTRVVADTLNSAAKNQNIDKKWLPPDCPLITKKFQDEDSGLLPHQYNVRNLLKDRPMLAALPIDAGGGKSMLGITDVLYEIKHGESAPYLIMCPSTLVANYVSELVTFTDGLVNVIPVTSYNINTSGIARYEDILKNAPINTILVVDYNVLKFRPEVTSYGTSPVMVFPVVEMLRKFKPGYVFMDESHKMKNAKSKTYKALMGLVADIPKKRIASGTMSPDSPSDLPGQIAFLDPTIFGTRDQYNEAFGAEFRGSRVTKWKAGAGGEAIAIIKRNIVWAPAKRREWACALPDRVDMVYSVDFSDEQLRVYNAIFDDKINSILSSAKNDKELSKLLKILDGRAKPSEDSDPENDFLDLESNTESPDENPLDSDASDEILSVALQRALPDIEQFVTDPSYHLYSREGYIDKQGNRHPGLTGRDLISPKMNKLAEVISDWLKEKKSKVIVFCNYDNSAEKIFASMPPELQRIGLHYTADEKVAKLAQFKNNKNIRWMVGIRQSLETGLNLQEAGCLIRMEGVWTDGDREQGDSRIERPKFSEGGDSRMSDGIKIATIMVDKTIDVTKAARLYAKMIAIAKFFNPNDPRYQDIEEMEVFPMTLQNIRSKNDFSTNLEPYANSIRDLNAAKISEYREYKEKLIAEGGFKMTQIGRTKHPADAKILSRVPYAQGTELYKAADLGLVRLDNFLGTDMPDDEDDENEADSSDVDSFDTGDDAAVEFVKAQKEKIYGLRCHTEYGDGKIHRGAAGRSKYISKVSIIFEDGTRVNNLRSTNVFVVTRTDTNSIDMRTALAKAAGLPVTEEITVPGNNLVLKVTQKFLKQREEEVLEKRRKRLDETTKKVSINLTLNIINGYMRLAYSDDDSTAQKVLQTNGFRTDNPYVYTKIVNAGHLLRQAKLWAKEGFQTTKETDNHTLALLYQEVDNGVKTHKHYTRMVNSGFDNYLRKTFKPNPDKDMISPFAIVRDGGDYDARSNSYALAYLCLPWGGAYAGTKEAIKPKFSSTPYTKWKIAKPSMSVFVKDLDAVKSVMNNLVASGVQIINIDEMNTYAKSVKKISPKVDNLDFDPEGTSGEGDPFNTSEITRREKPPKTKIMKKEKPTKVLKNRGRPPKEEPPRRGRPPKEEPPRRGRPPKEEPPRRGRPPKEEPPRRGRPPSGKPNKNEEKIRKLKEQLKKLKLLMKGK